MTFDDEITLIGDSVIYSDALGNQTVDRMERTILCHHKSVGRSEFYAAGVSGQKAEHVFIVNPFEFANQERVRFRGKVYDILRAYENHASNLGQKAYKNDYTGYLEIVAGERLA